MKSRIKLFDLKKPDFIRFPLLNILAEENPAVLANLLKKESRSIQTYIVKYLTLENFILIKNFLTTNEIQEINIRLPLKTTQASEVIIEDYFNEEIKNSLETITIGKYLKNWYLLKKNPIMKSVGEING